MKHILDSNTNTTPTTNRKIKFISILWPIVFFTANCGGIPPEPLTKENIKQFVRSSPQNFEQLKTGIFHGCVHVPAKDPIQKLILGFETTGETCTVTITKNNTVEISFLGADAIPVFSTDTAQYNTDTFIGESKNNQVLIVQHRLGEVVSVTQTVYDKNGNVVYGKSGQGDYIKECIFQMTAAERLAGKKDCGK